MAQCNVCFRQCNIKEGALGFCGARTCRDGHVIAANYGLVTSLALDPVEKKPLMRFYPGSRILSVGSYGCNLRCPFCQNHGISWSAQAFRYAQTADYLPPEELVSLACSCRDRGNIGLAFTYNEPLVGYEYVRDAAMLARAEGLKNVLVTNGTASVRVLEELAPYIDAMNIDLKGFTDRYYRDVLRGDRSMVMEFIRGAAQICHIELTCLVVPGENDTQEEMEEMADWIASLPGGPGRKDGREIPLHISRFFPRFQMTDRPATDVNKVYALVETARRYLRYVCPGNC